MKINNHLVTYGEWKEWTDYQEYIFEDEKVVNDYDAFKDTPSKEECDLLCGELSGEVVVYKSKKPFKQGLNLQYVDIEVLNHQ